MASISDSPLYFKQLIFKDSFQSISALAFLIIENYTKQGIFQIYSVLGSIDLLGNPIGLIDQLGTGVF